MCVGKPPCLAWGGDCSALSQGKPSIKAPNRKCLQKNLGGKTSLCRSYLREMGIRLLGGGISHPCGLPSPPVLLQIAGSGLCRMQEKASETFLSKIEQGLPFLSKLLPGRSRPLPAPLRPLALCTLTPSHEGPAWLFPGHCGHRSFLGSSSHLSC